MTHPERIPGATGPATPGEASTPREVSPVTRLAGCIIRNPADQILLVHKYGKRNQWETPGGKVDTGETTSAAAARELLEELGVVVEVGDILGVKEFDQGGKRRSYTWHNARIVAGTPTIRDTDEVDRIGWFGATELEAMRHELSGNTVNFLDELQAGNIHFN